MTPLLLLLPGGVRALPQHGHKCLVHTSNTRTLRSRGHSGSRSFRGGRTTASSSSTAGGGGGGSGGGGFHASSSSSVLLDKFVKRTLLHSSLVVKAPFHLRVRGSFFDADSNVDRHKNRQYREKRRQVHQVPTLQDIEAEVSVDGNADADDVRPPSPTPSPSPLPGDNPGQCTLYDTLFDLLGDDATDDERRDMKLVYEALIEHHSQEKSGYQQLANWRRSLLASSGPGGRRRTTPLHLLLYGRPHHRVDSYSLVDGEQEQTHLYLTDASSFEEAEAMLTHYAEQQSPSPRPPSAMQAGPDLVAPCGSIGIWQSILPLALKRSGKFVWDKLTGEGRGANESLDPFADDMAAGFHIHCPQHVMDAPDNGIKSVFLVPTQMSKIFLQADRDANVELDGRMISHMNKVGLYSEYGNIRINDLASDDVKMASRFGDILCEGQLHAGKVIVAETFAEGDFLARHVSGPNFTVTTENGDINVWGECQSQRSQFYTQCGHIHVRNLYNRSFLLIRDTGNLTVNVVQGCITAIVHKGTVFASVTQLTENSTIQVSEGEITVTIPPKPSFRILVIAATTNIAPRLLNSGEIYLDKKGREVFQSGLLGDPCFGGLNEDEMPTLKLRSDQGPVTIVMADQDQKKAPNATSSISSTPDDCDTVP